MKILHRVQKLPYWVICSGAVLVFIMLVFTSPSNDHHFLLNVEPYPDGLFYVRSALNIARSGHFLVEYQGFVLYPQITPLYSYLLAVGYFLSPQPGFFYFTNCVLGIITIIFLFLSLYQVTRKKWLICGGLAIYLSHMIVFWLPSVPMAENAVLALFSVTLFFLVSYLQSQRRRDLLLLLSCVLALVFAKYTLIGVSAVLELVMLVQVLRKRQTVNAGLIVGISGVTAAIFWYVQLHLGQHPLAGFSAQNFNQPSVVTGAVFYSFNYIWSNAITYVKALLGFKVPFLWLHESITTFGYSLLFLFGLGWLLIKKNLRSGVYLFVFLSQFPLLFIFYVVDQRYIILTLPLFALGITYLGTKVKSKKLFVTLLVASIALQCFSQLPFLRSLVAANMLNRSQAWQYEAVKVFNAQLPADSYIVTALPPLFVDLYSNHQYHLLPLSPKQEFLDKKQYVWGSEIRYQNLAETFSDLLSQNHLVFISNAYLSSNHEFSLDYQKLGDQFVFKKVAEGCFGTCDVFQLELKTKLH